MWWEIMQSNLIPLPKAIWKPKLIGGIETVPWVFIFITSAVIGYYADSWWRLLGVANYAFFHGICAYCNAKDPLFFKGIWRFLDYQDFYPNTAMHPSTNSIKEY